MDPEKYQVVVFKDDEFDPFAGRGITSETFNELARKKFGLREADIDPEYMGDMLGIAQTGGRIYAVHIGREPAGGLAQQKHPDVLYIGDWPEGTGPQKGSLRKPVPGSPSPLKQ